MSLVTNKKGGRRTGGEEFNSSSMESRLTLLYTYTSCVSSTSKNKKEDCRVVVEQTEFNLIVREHYSVCTSLYNITWLYTDVTDIRERGRGGG